MASVAPDDSREWAAQCDRLHLGRDDPKRSSKALKHHFERPAFLTHGMYTSRSVPVRSVPVRADAAQVVTPRRYTFEDNCKAHGDSSLLKNSFGADMLASTKLLRGNAVPGKETEAITAAQANHTLVASVQPGSDADSHTRPLSLAVGDRDPPTIASLQAQLCAAPSEVVDAAVGQAHQWQVRPLSAACVACAALDYVAVHSERKIEQGAQAGLGAAVISRSILPISTPAVMWSATHINRAQMSPTWAMPTLRCQLEMGELRSLSCRQHLMLHFRTQRLSVRLNQDMLGSLRENSVKLL